MSLQIVSEESLSWDNFWERSAELVRLCKGFMLPESLGNIMVEYQDEFLITVS
jgi:hypothetical protein